ncbi:ribosomal protein L11 methyltransferase [Rubripirellula amarantea]|uniref:Ribosomal protein L11 methyltransferase n=1 Tax=Rubripirellula amarantea TaxID=2527999 RepID=A0A5C5WPL3_9BACT|nr:50S ribosomal protein L11 methyltransferase [Rubripirellula amarantea]TWT52598.1 ribosomal protein L11 methyltransferase [Rubripirellula amarantea]
MKIMLAFLGVVIVAVLGCGVSYRDDLDYSYAVEQSYSLEEFEFGDGEHAELVQYEFVGLDLIAMSPIRDAIAKDRIADGRKVLEISSGTGLLSVLCLSNGAKQVVATDIQPAAVANTRYNAANLVSDGKIDARLRPASSSQAYSAIASEERFDLIITDANRVHYDSSSTPQSEANDKQESFVKSLIEGLPLHLTSNGRCLVLSDRKKTLDQVIELAQANQITLKTLDSRDPEILGEDFSPSFMVELRVPPSANE